MLSSHALSRFKGRRPLALDSPTMSRHPALAALAALAFCFLATAVAAAPRDGGKVLRLPEWVGACAVRRGRRPSPAP